MAILCMCNEKYAILALINGQIIEISAFFRKLGLSNTVVTSDFRLEVE